MNSTLYKRLFEVQILHDYYLTTADGISFFQKNQAEKKNVLTHKITNGLYDINKLFTIQPLEATPARLQEYKMVLSRTALGFVVGVAVNAELKAGEMLYKPSIPLSETLSLTFAIGARVPFFTSMTNSSLSPPLPSKYYFTNKDKAALNEAAVPNYTSLPLANTAMNNQNGTIHEMGAIINFGGTLKEALQKTDGSIPAHWENISDKRVMSNADRILLPNTFTYPVNETAGVTQLQAILEDNTATVVKTITLNSVQPMGDKRLNFSRINEYDINSENIPSGFYTLKIKVNGGLEMSYPVYLNTLLFQNSSLGVMDIRLEVPGSPYSLLDTDGFLKTKITAANVKVPHPVFEIRFKNRRTYWRYQQETDFSVAEKAATAAHLGQQANKLISIKPKALTAALVPFINGVSLMLPHPRKPSVKVEEDKIFSEIFINQSNRLLNN